MKRGGVIDIDELVTIPLLVSSGVLGYLSYWLLVKRGKIITRGAEDRVAGLLFISFWIFLLMWSLYHLLSWNDWLSFSHQWAILISLIGSIIISVYLSWIFPARWMEWINRRIDARRKSEGQAGHSTFTARHYFFNKSEHVMVFIFGFDNELIISGYSRVINENHAEEFEMSLEPFNKSSHLKTLKTHQDILDYIEDKEIRSEILVNFDQKIKIYKIMQP